MNIHEKDDNELLNSRMFDEYSLADSQTLGTGYVVDVRDGSISMITDDMVDDEHQNESRKGTFGENALEKEFSGWNVFNSLFSRSPTNSVKKLSRNYSSRSRKSTTNNSNKSNTPEEFEDNVNNLYGNADFYFNSNYNSSLRRQRNRKMFRELSEKAQSQKQLQQKQQQNGNNGDGNENHPPSPLQDSYVNNDAGGHGGGEDAEGIEMNNIVVDFLKDDPSEMTWGRRIALKWMKHSWYYPATKSKETTEEDFIDQLILDATKNRSGKAILQAISTSEDGENGDDNNDKSNNDEKKNNSVHDIEQVEVFHNDPTTSTFIVPPSLEKAWAYFEHITLPRYVYEERKETSYSSCVNPKGLEIAESGERYFKTKLYHPFFTPLDQLAEFGLGIGLYFTTLRSIMILMFIVGLMNIPNLLFFAGSVYSNGQPNVLWSLKGSAVCTDYEFVPCIDCNEENFESALGRYRSIETADGALLSFALKNNCDGATQTTIMTNLATIIVTILGLTIISYFLSIDEVKLDEDVQTAQDYSIVISNPPTDAGDVEEWRDYFTKKFENVHVSCCTIAVHNERLLKALVKRRELLHKLRKTLPPGESLDKMNLEIITEDMRDEQCCGSFFGAPVLYERLLDLEEKIKQLLVEEKPVVSVFVTFETESSQRRVLKALRREAAKRKNFDKKYAFREGYDPLLVKEAAEPSAVRWQDLSEPMIHIVTSYIIPFTITFSMMFGSAILVRWVRKGFWNIPPSPTGAALIINIGNTLFPYVARFLTDFEVHRREGQKETSLYIKYALFRWVNTAVVTTLITPLTSTLMGGERDTLVVIFNIFLFQIIFSILHFLDFVQNLKRHFFAPRAKTQEDMNTLMGGMELDLAERYSNMTTTLFLTVWYCPIYPAVFFFGGAAMFVNLIADKFRLMRSWAPAPRLGATISKINRRFFFPITSIVMILIATYTWCGFNYDNLCAVQLMDELEEYSHFNGTHSIPSFANIDVTVELQISSNSTIYKYCDQSAWNNFFPAIHSLGGFQNIEWMTGEQKYYTDIMGWTGIALIAAITISVSYSLGYNLGRIRKTDKKKITFSASGANAYIPEVKSTIMPFPLIACSVYEVANPNLFEWSSPYHPLSYYDLTLDALDIMRDSDNQISASAFSRVRHWEAPLI